MSIKVIAAGIIGLLIIAAAYFAVTSYRDMAAENTKLKGQVTQLNADNKALENAADRIAKGLSANQESTTRVIERTREIERQINASPTTTKCLDAPAIGVVLGSLRDKQAGSDDQVSKPSVPVP